MLVGELNYWKNDSFTTHDSKKGFSLSFVYEGTNEFKFQASISTQIHAIQAMVFHVNRKIQSNEKVGDTKSILDMNILVFMTNILVSF